MTFRTFVEPFERSNCRDLEAPLTELNYLALSAPLLSVQIRNTFKSMHTGGKFISDFDQTELFSPLRYLYVLTTTLALWDFTTLVLQPNEILSRAPLLSA